MCKAFDEIVQESEARGISQGKATQLYELVKEDLLSLAVGAEKAGQTEAESKAGMEAYYA